MMPYVDDPATYIAGAFAGICVLVLALSLLIGYAYNERMLWWHAATLTAALLVEVWSDTDTPLATLLWTLQLAIAALTLRATVGASGPTRRPGIALALLSPVFGLAAVYGLFRPPVGAWLLLPWAAAMAWALYRAWMQNRPWIYWLALGQAALAVQGMLAIGITPGPLGFQPRVESMGALALFAVSTYLALVWFSRLRAENVLRIEARERSDPLTGLSMPVVFFDRVDGALIRSRNMGYHCALLVVRIGNVDKIIEEEHLDSSESVILAASRSIRGVMRAQDSSCRLGNNRFALLAEGITPGSAGAIATRLMAHGMRAGQFRIVTSQLHFQIAVVEVRRADVPAKDILQELDHALTRLSMQNRSYQIKTLPRVG